MSASNPILAARLVEQPGQHAAQLKKGEVIKLNVYNLQVVF
jgi:hypothetical protein